MKKTLYLIMLCAMVFQPGAGLFGSKTALRAETNPQVQAAEDGGNPPGWPLPAKAVPHHEPGHLANSLSYTSQVDVLDEKGAMQTLAINGLDALAVDGRDPLSGNYTLVGMDKLLRSSTRNDGSGNNYGMETFNVEAGGFSAIADSQLNIGYIRENDIAAGDLNNDGQAEQIAAWLDLADASLNISVGEMPGSLGRSTSAPAAAARDAAPAKIDLLVRGYDYGLWHCQYSSAGGCESWENGAGGGVLLSAPAIVSKPGGEFDAYAILNKPVGQDNYPLLYRRSWSGAGWSGAWEPLDSETAWAPLTSLMPVPELAAPAAVGSGSSTELFRLSPDNTLRWCHYTGTPCTTWENLGGMLASGPVAIQLDGAVRVFTRGFDDALWSRTYTGSAWQGWQRVVLAGLPEGVTLASAPAVVSPQSGQIDVSVQGSDGHLWAAHYEGGSWGAWSDQGGELASAPAAALLAGEHTAFSRIASGGLQVNTIAAGWAELPGGIPPIPTQVDFTGLIGVRKYSVEMYHDFSVDVETGYFWGDGRSQIVVGYFSAAQTVQIGLFDLSDSPNEKGFTPELVSSAPFQLPDAADYFAIATGDFLAGDGIDDIAVSYVSGRSLNVDFLRFNPALRTLEKVPVTFTPFTWDSNWVFTGTHEVVSGDFDGDGRAELAVNFIWKMDTAILLDGLLGHKCPWGAYEFHFRTFVYDIFEAAPQQPVVKSYLAEPFFTITGHNDASMYSVATSLAAGDVNGDGKDEIVRTIPQDLGTMDATCDLISNQVKVISKFKRTAQVLDLGAHTGEKPAWSKDGDGVISEQTKTNLVIGPTSDRSYGDRLIVGDLDRDRIGEIIIQVGISETSQVLVAFKIDPTTNPVTYPYFALQSLAWGDFSHLVVGDFTHQGLRVGQPSYRKENRVDTLVAMLNMPPKHRDVIDVNGANQLIEVTPDSYAQHSSKESATSTTKTTAVRDWGLSTELAGEGSVYGVEIKASIGYSYGNNFERSTTAINSTNFTLTAKAIDHDQIIYYGAPYQVWEYPVLDPDSGEILDYMLITFPLITNNTTPSSSTQYGDICSENPYNPEHQLYNLWSYDPSGPVLFDDFDLDDEDKTILRPSSGYSGDTWFEATHENSNNTIETSKISHKVDASLEVGGKIPAVAEVKFTVKGNYSTEQIQTDEVTKTDSTTISAYIGQQSTADTITVYPILYWAKNGYLVLDYQVDPSAGSTWQKYNKPDPAFILPWYGTPYLDPVLGYQIAPSPCNDKQLYSPEVVIEPANASIGDPVTISATIRNFSNDAQAAHNVVVRFYQGSPALNVVIGQVTVPTLSRATGGAIVSIPWIASGLGKQKIYAVIDPADATHPFGQIHEMHDNHDLINNNIAFNYIQIGAADYFDMGTQEIQEYQGQAYAQMAGMQISFHLPPQNLSQVIRFDLGDAYIPLYNILGNPFSLAAYENANLAEPAVIPDLDLRSGADQPPAVLSLAYGALLPPGMDESSLGLYRLGTTGWEDASCGIVARLPQDHLIAVPVCQTGLFALSVGTPVTPQHVFLPAIRR